MLDHILEQRGLKFEDLKPEAGEVDTLMGWLKELQEKQVTVERIHAHVREMIGIVERALVKEPPFEYYFGGLLTRENHKNTYLKARLENYLLLLDFLDSPIKAKQALEEALSRIAPAREEDDN